MLILKRFHISLLAILEAVNVLATDGALSGRFTINANGDQVIFSQGNLQYQPSTHTWRFAEHQYDYVGDATKGNVYENSIKSNNLLIDNTYSGWIDLFSWGTGNNPTNYSNNYLDYQDFFDWGNYVDNSTGNVLNPWRTLSKEEWTYIFFMRLDSTSLFGFGCVAGVNGCILLPDNWVLPVELSFVSAKERGILLYEEDTEYFQYFNENADNYTHNTYTAEQWEIMEAGGAVFFPAAGYRQNIQSVKVYNCEKHGLYWTNSKKGNNNAYNVSIEVSRCMTNKAVATLNLGQGNSVRLAKNYIEEVSTGYENFSLAEGRGRIVLKDGHVMICFRGHCYDILGNMLK